MPRAADNAPRVCWSDRLETLAEGVFRTWEAVRDPFARVCIVTGDAATRDALQRRFLLHRPPGPRRVWANVEFKPLAEFVNDWLAAQTHGAAARAPAEHPYAKNVLAWRIDALLRRRALDPRLRPLLAYIGASGASAAARRRDLSVRLAQTYDDYLASRSRLLLNWAAGRWRGADEEWQGVLYHLLTADCPDDYAADYARAADPAADLDAAFRNGFPRYAAVHVFDVSFAPLPYLRFLQRLAEKLPVVFWTFNPAPQTYWMDDAADDLLLGALASGARGVLRAEVDFAGGDCALLCGPEPFAPLRETETVDVHVCHSPRRELEALRNALHGFFADHPDARPRDALVLCADWETYAPLVEAVFGAPGQEGAIPVACVGAPAESPVLRAFRDLLAFRDNRFEVSAVFALLGVPAVRRTFGLDAADVAVLRDLAREANIHWGYDDADVADILGAASGAPHPFTWRRGLDRLTLDALMGARDDEDARLDAGAFGALRPCGRVEGDRARAVAALAACVRRLARLRAALKRDRDGDAWRDLLTAAVADFFTPDNDEAAAVASLRRAAAAVAGDLRTARRWAPGDDFSIAGDVFAAAVLDRARETAPASGGGTADAVRFARLTCGAAVPARFVWVCGLNDGVFPSDAPRPSFDLIGRHPSLFDVSPRERDAFALLKAAFGARQILAFSYIGRDIRSNEAIPPAVPLADLLDWYGPGRVTTYAHPLQSYSPDYFLPSGARALPRNWSRDDRAAAVRLLARRHGAPPPDAPRFPAFVAAADGETRVDLDDLVAFFTRPSAWLARARLHTRTDTPGRDVLDDAEPFDAHLPYRVRIALKTGAADEASLAPDVLVETGAAPDAEAVRRALAGVLDDATVGRLRRRTLDFKEQSDVYRGGTVGALDALAAVDAAPPTAFEVVAERGGRTVRTVGALPMADLAGMPHTVCYLENKASGGASAPEERAAVVRHVAGHAAGLSFATVLVYGDGTLRALWPLARDAAARKWADILDLAFGDLPEGLPRTDVSWADDAPPPDMEARLMDGLVFVASKQLPRAKKGAA